VTKEIIGKEHESGEHYILGHQMSKVAFSRVISLFDAHCRLGHPSLSMVNKFCSQFHNLSCLISDTCQFFKFHHLI